MTHSGSNPTEGAQSPIWQRGGQATKRASVGITTAYHIAQTRRFTQSPQFPPPRIWFESYRGRRAGNGQTRFGNSAGSRLKNRDLGSASAAPSDFALTSAMSST